MKKIQMVDLAGQYHKIKDEADLAIMEVIESTAFIQGPQVKKFERELEEFNNVRHCISCANGTDALQIAMMALDLRPGDEVVVPAFTYIATVEAAALLGLKVALADVDPLTFNLSPESVLNSIHKNTKLIVPVHLYGQCADMDALFALAKKNDLHIIEDCAQAIGAKYTFSDGRKSMAGTMGTVGITSFFPSKNLGCFGDGGALFTNDETLAKKIKMIANHGQDRKYYHDIIGVNSRLDTLQAAVLSVKLKYLGEYISARQNAAMFYNTAFNDHASFDVPFQHPSSTHVYNQYTLTLKHGNRDELRSFLASKGIPTMIYYPEPVHFQKAYAGLGYRKGDFPVSERLAASVISLPMHTELEEDQLSYIADHVLQYFKNK